MRQICARHDIPYRSHARITTGFSHEVHRLNDDLVVKLFDFSRSRNYKTELALLKSVVDFPKPKFVASHDATSEHDRSYIIMSFVQGMSLGGRWHMATDEQREGLIRDISKVLITINSLDPKTISESSEAWETIVENRIIRLTDKLVDRTILSEEQARKVAATTRKNKKYVANSRLFPVYWDVHFDNFLVDENFELQAIIDLENVELAALDYPLFVVRKLIHEPHKYLREEDEKYADIQDYVKLEEWYKKHYPALFAFENQDERVKLYELIDTLHLLVDWPQVHELYDKLNVLTRE